MAVVRTNVLDSPHASTFLQGAGALSRRLTNATPAGLNASHPADPELARIHGSPTELNQPLSVWDLFCWWHVLAMSSPAETGNRAHMGPIFLPWHRMYLRRLEEAMQSVMGDPDFALPYWDWAADGELFPAPAAQLGAEVWSLLGPTNGFVLQGPLANMRVRLYQSPEDLRLYVTAPRPLWRAVGRQRWPNLPDRNDQVQTLNDDVYDDSDWDTEVVTFRNKVEGWVDPTQPPPEQRRRSPWMHNRVHVWIGGDMEPGSSPNDPVFYLNHCNVDRLWEAWMRDHGRTYAPPAGQGPGGHRADDDMLAIIWPSMTPQDVLDPTESGLDWYRYDQLP